MNETQSPSQDAPLLSKPPIIFALMLLMVALMLRANWHSDFYAFDDKGHVALALDKPASDWVRPRVGSTFFPVTLFSYWLDSQLFRGTAAPADPSDAASTVPVKPGSLAPAMRVINGLYHLLAGFLLWKFLTRAGFGTGLSAFVALAWTGHPLACESVCWISERKNVLSALFAFAALWAWSGDRSRLWRWPLVWFFYALALLSKPSALGLLPVLFALDILDPHKREFQMARSRDWLTLAERMVVPVLLSIAAVAIGMQSHQQELVEPPGGSVFTALLTDIEIFGRYIFNVLLPVNLSFFYAVEPVTSFADSRVLFYGLAIAGVLGGLIWLAGPQRRSLAILGAIWFLGALGPNSNIVAIPFWMQDRYLYIASVGLLILLAAGLSGLVDRVQEAEIWLPRAAGAYLVILAVLLTLRSEKFSDSDNLCMDAVKRQPTSGMARLSLAHAFRRVYYEAANAKPPDPESAQRAATYALKQYQQAGLCTDISRLVDSFSLRAWAAELALATGNGPAAIKLLEELPPEGMTMRSRELIEQGGHVGFARSDFLTSYPPQTLAGAFLIRGEAKLQESYLKAITPVSRIDFVRQAIQDAEKSTAAHQLKDEAYVLKGKGLLRLGHIHATQADMPKALASYNEGLAFLKKLPETSASARTAKQIIERVPPPSLEVTPQSGALKEGEKSKDEKPKDKITPAPDEKEPAK